MRVFGVFLSLNGLLFILCEREKFYYFLFLGAGVGLFLVRQTRKIVHAGSQCHRHTAALLKAEIPLAALDLGIGTLVDAGQHLHFDLGIAPLFSELPQSVHIHHRLYYAESSYCN